MWDAHGKEYLDFAAGIAVNALGKQWLRFLQHGCNSHQALHEQCECLLSCCDTSERAAGVVTMQEGG